MLLSFSSVNNRTLQSFAQADSLIMSELQNFNIPEEHIRVVQTRVDSNFMRKSYRVRVAPQFSKTQLHAELNKTFHDYNVSTPARVTFPNKDITIYLEYNNTVIRSISMQTDPELSIIKNRASLLLIFDQVPGDDVLTELTSLGEPLPIVLKVENPMQANKMREELENKYSRIVYWLQSKNNENILPVRSMEAQAVFKQMKEVMPDAVILRILDTETTPADERGRLVAQSGLSSINLAEPVIFDDKLSKSAFMDKLNTFANQSTSQNHPVGLIMANKRIIGWLKEQLPELKKNGLEFVPPPSTNR